MNNTPYDFLVFIGRFQPFHKGHLSVIEAGLKQAKQLIILCGSAHQPRSARNPWSPPEREAMIRGALSAGDNKRVHIAPLMDSVYNDESWVRNVQTTVNGIVTAQYSTPHLAPKIGLIGHSKDQSSYYLNLFPQWGAVAVDSYKNISATPIRESVFHSDPQQLQNVPPNVRGFLQEFCASGVYMALRDEYRFISTYKQAWANAPYPPTFVTVDAIVVQSGHVLMVERKARPGKGLWALPGGFVNQGEKLLQACLRELREETRLKVPEPVLKGSIQAQQVFDDPHRSSRGRTITHAFYMELQPNNELPKVKGGDDATHAKWVPLAELNPTSIFEDHYFIIQNMTGM
ncbi:bifunctional nicotinamide-nucleotide adenylyltransferase/Nudix hydroxylase [Ketobacter sp.]|nr:MAG: bifunctional nicotinamide-nucleotide adenylyltransferase/Nudix hydroxylase [Ketobacter sp.]